MVLLNRKLPCADSGKWRLRTNSLPPVGRTCVSVHSLHRLLLVRVVDVAGERRAPVVVAVRGVGDEVLAPAVDDVAPGVGERIGDEDAQLLGARLVAEHAGVVDANRAVRRLDLRVEEGPFLEVERAVRAPREGVDRVVAVLGAEAVQDDPPHVGAVVAVGVLQEHQVRLLRDVDAAVAEREAGRDVEPIGEDLDLVGAAVAVAVLEDDQLVVRRLVRTDVRIRGRRQHPQPPARVEGHRQRVGQLGELALGGEQRHLVAGRRLEPRQRHGGILRGEVEVAAEVRLLARRRLCGRHAGQGQREERHRRRVPGHRASPFAMVRARRQICWSCSAIRSSSRFISPGKFTEPNGLTRRPTMYSAFSGRKR